MGMGVFTGRFQNWDFGFTLIALLACLIGRLLNIVPLSWLANICRTGRQVISPKMQMVLWFAGLRGAIAFALSEAMPGPNKEVYTTVTLTICIFTTVVCGGFTEKILTLFGMKEEPRFVRGGNDTQDDGWQLNQLSFKPPTPSRRESYMDQRKRRLRDCLLYTSPSPRD